MWRYFAHHHSKDSTLVRAAVGIAFLSDSICTATIFAIVYLYVVTHWGDIFFLAKEP